MHEEFAWIGHWLGAPVVPELLGSPAVEPASLEPLDGEVVPVPEPDVVSLDAVISDVVELVEVSAVLGSEVELVPA